tara:strand:+ start:107 stop:358 length:252 start_codon:yes stop_codon:yes gene_type:complete
MKKVIIYSSLTCPYCYKAKKLLNKLKISFIEISVDSKPKIREEMAIKAGKTSVPQIWFGDSHIGGCDELYELYAAGGLFKVLS